MIPYGKQSVDDNDIQSVIDVLKSKWLTQGPKVPEFEQAIATYCNAKHAVAVNSATSALHIACLALGIDTTTRVWTSPNSFVASANCALYCGARVDFVDIDLTTGNICVHALEQKLVESEKLNLLPDVVIPVHFAGQSCDMRAIKKLADRFNFKVIEDASHAIGGQYEGVKIGSCQFSDICVFSFHPVKIITSAEGGMLLTNDDNVANKLKMLRSHGITSDPHVFSEESHGVWYYQQQLLGFNYRMTDIHAALGLSQLAKIDEFVAKRNAIVGQYLSLLSDDNRIRPLVVNQQCYSAYHLFVVTVSSLNMLKHKKLVKLLRENDVQAHVHYIPIYLQPYYQQLGFKPGHCSNAEQYYHTAITLPLFPELQGDEVIFIVDNLKRCLDTLTNCD